MSDVSTALSADEVQAIDQSYRRFSVEAVGPAVQRPEHPIGGDVLRGLVAGATELGMLNPGDEEGYGLWELAHDAAARRLSATCLSHLAGHSAGVALHFHQLALGAYLGRRLGAGGARGAVPVLHGTYGLGRHLLPRLLRGGALDAEERRWLSAYFSPAADAPLVAVVGEGVNGLWLPAFDGERGTLGFARVPLDRLEVTPLADNHGMDELRLVVIEGLPASVEPAAVAPALVIAVFCEAMQLHSLGLLAIATGGLRAAHAMATEYAAIRVQAGVPIARHAAVQTLLGRGAASAAAGDTLLDALCRDALSLDGMRRCLAARADFHGMACAAVSDALQAFGGIGYMRDTGIEKRLRDQNHLRVLCGTPDELRRLCVELVRSDEA